MNVVSTQKEIKELSKKIKKLNKKVSELYDDKKDLEEFLRENCSHPIEFRRDFIIYGNKPLVVSVVMVYCNICNKLVKSYNM